ncbi:MAG TPA: DedA family protein [Acidimicrobiales bacterium]
MLSASIVSFLIDKIQLLSGGLVYTVVALLVFGEAALFIGFVLPGETSVIVAGVVASQGRVNIVVLCALVVVAAIIGDSVGYEVGRHYGKNLMALPILNRRHAELERALEGLRRRGVVYVFIGRFTAFLRAVMPGLAGMSRMRYRRFLAANATGALLWGVGFTLIGYFAGSALTSIEKYSGWAGTSLLVLVVVALVAYHFVKKRRDAMTNATWEHEQPDGDSEQSAE